jgi:RNA polymerase sigma factor (sigma-70 family)
MRDGDIVAAAVSGHPAALVAAYDQYGPGLYAYCRSLVNNPVDAADALQDTFAVAAARVGGLRDPGRLRPWLYAVARNECRRQLAGPHLSRSVADDDATMISRRIEDSPTQLDQLEQRELVSSALAGLDRGDREIIELTLRDELYGADLADAVGVPRNQAQALAARARTRFEAGLAMVMAARPGQDPCAELAAILGNSGQELSGPVRKQARRHLATCPICAERQRQSVNAFAMLNAGPAPVLPGGLRYQVLSLLTDTSPEAAAYCASVASRAEPFSHSGFPVPLDPLRTVRRPATFMPAAAVAVALLALFGGSAVLISNTLHRSSAPTSSTAVAPAASAHPAPAVHTPAPGASRHRKRAGQAGRTGPASPGGGGTSGTAKGQPTTAGHSATPRASKPRHTATPATTPSSGSSPTTQPATPTPTATVTPSSGLVGSVIGLLASL